MDYKKRVVNSTTENTNKITASGNAKKINASPLSINKEKEPFLGETDILTIVFVAVFAFVFFGIRYFQASSTKESLSSNSISTAKNNQKPDSVKGGEIPEGEEEIGENPNEVPEEGEHWIFYTEEITIKGDQIVCKNAKTDKYAVFFLKDCRGKVVLEDEFAEKNEWLEFPGKKLVLWKAEEFKKAVENSVSTEILYLIDYEKYSGNVTHEKNNKDD